MNFTFNFPVKEFSKKNKHTNLFNDSKTDRFSKNATFTGKTFRIFNNSGNFSHRESIQLATTIEMSQCEMCGSFGCTNKTTIGLVFSTRSMWQKSVFTFSKKKRHHSPVVRLKCWLLFNLPENPQNDFSELEYYQVHLRTRGASVWTKSA